MAEERAQRRLAAILAADVVGYSRLMQLDEAGTLAALKARRSEVLQPVVSKHHGRIVKLMGDGVLVEFASAVNAVTCAVELQEKMAAANDTSPEDRRLVLRIGINLGDVIVEGSDLYGDGVNVAARLEALAEPGGICISDDAHRQVRDKLDFGFEDAGEHQLKNIVRPLRIFRVRIAGTVPRRRPRLALPDMPSIAVLPFTNMSGDPEQEYFSDGITEDLIIDLSIVPGLFVFGRTATFAYRAPTTSLQRVRAELNARYVLTGSIRKAEGRLRITAQLIDCQTMGTLWGDRFDRNLTDVFAIQDEIVHRIVEALKLKLRPNEAAEIAKVPTDNVEAYNYYLLGRTFMHQHSKDARDIAKRMFQKALELDATFARAYAGLAFCEAFRYLSHYGDSQPDTIIDISAKALQLDDNLAEAHAARGFALSAAQRNSEAELEFKRAIHLDPNLFEAYYYGARVYFLLDRVAEAAELLERAISIRPDDYQAPVFLSDFYTTLGRPEDALAIGRLALDRVEQELLLHPENVRATYLGASIMVKLGAAARAKEWASRALAMEPDDTLTQYNVACVYAELGDSVRAIELLERALQHSHDWVREWIQHDSSLASLRSNSAFQKLLHKIEH